MSATAVPWHVLSVTRYAAERNDERRSVERYACGPRSEGSTKKVSELRVKSKRVQERLSDLNQDPTGVPLG